MTLRPDFVVSDTHWFHKNIIKYCDRPMGHNEMMLKRWRAAVGDQHTILHLGDLFFGKPGSEGYKRFSEEIAPYLTGTKYLLLGNHDKKSIDYESLGFTVLEPYSIQYQDFIVTFDHYPRREIHDGLKRLHLHGHIHNNPYEGGALAWPNNINVSVEVIDYRPQRLGSLVNAALLARKDKEPRLNSRSYRARQVNGQRRAA